MKRATLIILAVLFVIISTVGCNALRGAGTDVKNAGTHMENAGN